MTTTLKKIFLGTVAKVHTIHPGLVLPLVAVAGWLVAPALVMGAADKQERADQPVAMDGAAAKPAEANTEFLNGLLGGLFGGGASSGSAGAGGGGSGSGSDSGNSSRSKPPGQMQASLGPKTSTTGAAPAHPGPTTPADGCDAQASGAG